MGYCISVNCDNFSFDVSKAKDLMRDVKSAFKSGAIEGRWIYEDDVIEAKTIEEMFEELRFELYKDGDKYKIDYFTGEKLDGCEKELFKSMAKYIDEGSYLEYIGEDGEQWRYIFKNGDCKEVYPTITYENDINNKELLEKLKDLVLEHYDSEMCGATSEWSAGNDDDVFSDGEASGSSWLAYEIGCLLGMELETPQEPKYSWE